MNSYAEELNRRIGQFTKILNKMHRRAHEEIHGPCFAIFAEDDPRSGLVVSCCSADPDLQAGL